MRRHILIVDDDPLLREAILEVLKLEGHPAKEAPDGEEALRAIEGHRPDLLLLDLDMPIMDGWELAWALRCRSIEVPIIVITADEDARHRAGAIPAVEFFHKPFEMPEFLSAVEHHYAA